MNTYEVYYKKNISLADYDGTNLSENYAPVHILNAECPEEVFWGMQGKNWLLYGEKQGLIDQLKLSHISMMEGDLIVNVDNGKYFLIESISCDVYPKGEQND